MCWSTSDPAVMLTGEPDADAGACWPSEVLGPVGMFPALVGLEDSGVEPPPKPIIIAAVLRHRDLHWEHSALLESPRVSPVRVGPVWRRVEAWFALGCFGLVAHRTSNVYGGLGVEARSAGPWSTT